MADRGRQRREAPRRALIGPLAMLAGGAMVGVMVWRILMLEPAPSGLEQLSQHDRGALERFLDGRVRQ